MYSWSRFELILVLIEAEYSGCDVGVASDVPRTIARDPEQLDKVCRINAACSPRVSAPSIRLARAGRLPGTAAPTLDIQGEER